MSLENAHKQPIITNIEKEEVDHPEHYNKGDIECIDAIHAAGHGEGFCVGSAIKYLWRAKHKEDECKDLKKAVWYLTWFLNKEGIEFKEGEPKQYIEAIKEIVSLKDSEESNEVG